MALDIPTRYLKDFRSKPKRHCILLAQLKAFVPLSTTSCLKAFLVIEYD